MNKVEDDNELMDLTVVLYDEDNVGESIVEHITASSIKAAVNIDWPANVRVLAVFEGHHMDLTAREEVITGCDQENERYVVAFQSSIRRIDNKPFADSATVMVQYSPLFAHHDLAAGWADIQAGVVLLKVNKRCVWSTEVKHSL